MVFYYRGNQLDLDSKYEFFAQTRHSYGRTAIHFSGGATFGIFHYGLIKALTEADLFPRIVCGSSVGSLVAAFVCARPYEELASRLTGEQIQEDLLLKFRSDSVFTLASRLLQGKDILDNSQLQRTIRMAVKDYTFKDLHDKFKWTLNITVTDLNMQDESRLLNYLTAPDIVVWSACGASCAIPKLYSPQKLKIKLANGDIVDYSPTLG